MRIHYGTSLRYFVIVLGLNIKYGNSNFPQSVTVRILRNNIYLEISFQNPNVVQNKNTTIGYALLSHFHHVSTVVSDVETWVGVVRNQNIARCLVYKLELIGQRHVGHRNITKCIANNIATGILWVQWVFINIEIEPAETTILVVDHQSVLTCVGGQKVVSGIYGVPCTT